MNSVDEDSEADEDTIRRMSTLEQIMDKTSNNKFPNMGSARRLTRELLSCYEAQSFDAELVEDNLYEWIIRIVPANLDQQSGLAHDLRKMKSNDDRATVDVRLSFPQDFPFSAPFAYIVRPRLLCPYVFDGALCMELLVHWNPAHSSVEAILVQICSLLTEGNARINAHDQSDYSEQVARVKFQGLKIYHDEKGWAGAPRR